MRQSKYRPVIIALLLMVFIGQAVASTAMSCHNQSAPPPIKSLMGSDPMDHSQHAQHQGTMTHSQERTATDCCADCDCAVGSCSSAALPPHHARFSFTPMAAASAYNVAANAVFFPAAFRPPITR